ncbi:uncharacterized protein LOC120575385 [Perca fluviatilis]|uniref:uncharacterized protein LOC120575385 n=1 Tax=Perca fluviatilis TaxID=8168 RepID=UPI0019651D19|nr:uncharacterized protein LOC120575385 [Perca fluviatilis]
MPTPEDGEPHDCLAELAQTCTPRPDLSDTPMENPDLILYVDGSASRCPQTGQGQVGFAVVSDTETMIAKSLPNHLSAQAAELIALTEACKLADGSSVTIFTDSRYAFGVVHDFGALWKHRQFLKSDGKPVLHHHLINDLLTAILLPTRVAVCKCTAHTGAQDAVSRGNSRADIAAKAAARLPLTLDTLAHTAEDHFSLPESVIAMQTHATPQERQQWKTVGCTFNTGIWLGPDSKPCLPKHFFPHFAKLTHGLDHISKGGMMVAITQTWFTKGFTTFAENFCKACIICAQHNIGRGVNVT